MRFISVVWKDLRIDVRQRKTLALMALTPIIIMLLVGSVFTGGAERGLQNVSLSVSGAQTKEGALVLESIRRAGVFDIAQLNVSSVEMEGLVRSGAYSAGMVLPSNQSAPMIFYLDDSQLQVAPIISAMFLTVTEKVSFEITLAFLERLWSTLQRMNAQIDPLATEVRNVNASINDINEDAQQIKVSMDSLDTEGLKGSLTGMEGALNDMEVDLETSRKDLNATRDDLRRLNSSVGEINSESTQLRDDMRVVIDNINSTDQALEELQNDLVGIHNSTCLNLTAQTGKEEKNESVEAQEPQPSNDTRCASIERSINQINATRALMLNRTSRIVNFYENLNRVAQSSAEMQIRLGEIDSRLEEMDRSMASYLGRISDLRGEISPIDSAITDVESIRRDSASTFDEVSRLTLEINRNADELVSALEESKFTLEEVVALPPAAVVSPIVLKRLGVFAGRSYLDFLLPSITSIVLMLVCLLMASMTVVNEKSGGTLVRTLLSPIRLHELLIGKMIALLIVAISQGLIILAIAKFVYGVGIPLQYLSTLGAGVLIYSASFVAIGMALAAFADTENTAMLSSLVLSVPMLFLNGVFFPFEMMPPSIAALGKALPLTQGIVMFRSITLYGRGIPSEVPYILGGYLALAYALAYVQMRRVTAG